MRKFIKRHLYGSRGFFRYFGSTIYFPPNSGSFLAACEQGIFEKDVVRTLLALTRPGTTFFDVGANIGLMAVPVLQGCPTCRVISFEPSPSVLPFLERTVRQSGFGERWTLVTRAAGAHAGTADFCVTAEAGGLYDGLRNTGRVAVTACGNETRVVITTLDAEWQRLGRPGVSMIKIDVEGGELDVLVGASECVAAERPDILLEWNRVNLAAYGRQPVDLFEHATATGYRIFAVPSFTPVEDASVLELQMLNTENFLLRPNIPVKQC